MASRPDKKRKQALRAAQPAVSASLKINPHCPLKGCGKLGTWKCVASFSALGFPKGARATIEVGLAFCDDHTGPGAFTINDQGWAMIERALAMMGKARADRSSLLIDYVPLHLEHQPPEALQ